MPSNINGVISSGAVVIIVTNLFLPMLSITPSTRNALEKSPSMEYSPVVTPKIKKVEAAISRSVMSSAVPTSLILVYFLMMSAIMSVPPEEALQLNIIAAPAAVESIASTNSRNTSFVSGN